MVQFLESGELVLLAGYCKGPFDGIEHPHFLTGHEDDGISFSPGTSGSSNPVGVGFQIKGGVIIKNMRNAVNIEPAGRDISGHKNINLTPL